MTRNLHEDCKVRYADGLDSTDLIHLLRGNAHLFPGTWEGSLPKDLEKNNTPIDERAHTITFVDQLHLELDTSDFNRSVTVFHGFVDASIGTDMIINMFGGIKTWLEKRGMSFNPDTWLLLPDRPTNKLMTKFMDKINDESEGMLRAMWTGKHDLEQIDIKHLPVMGSFQINY